VNGSTASKRGHASAFRRFRIRVPLVGQVMGRSCAALIGAIMDGDNVYIATGDSGTA
jgi:hypothetical protein